MPDVLLDSILGPSFFLLETNDTVGAGYRLFSDDTESVIDWSRKWRSTSTHLNPSYLQYLEGVTNISPFFIIM